MKRTLLIFTGAVLAFSIIGCAPKIMSTEGGVYQGFRLFAVSERNMNTVYEAALQAISKLELNLVDKAKDAFGAKVVARSSDDKMIVVEIRQTEDNRTMYNIKVGTFGNEERSQKIFMEMNKILMEKK